MTCGLVRVFFRMMLGGSFASSALAPPFELLVVLVGVVVLVCRHLLGLVVDQRRKDRAVGHVPRRDAHGRNQFAVRIRDSPGVGGQMLGES